MKTKGLMFWLMISLLTVSTAYGLDWKTVHESAHTMPLSQARQKVAQNPGSVKDLYRLGVIYLDRYQYEQAAGVFDRMHELAPEGPEARWGRAAVLLRQYEFDQSEALLEEVIRADPDFAPAYVTLAYLRYYQRDFQQTVRLAKKVIRMGRERVNDYTYARAYLILGGTKGMLAHFGGPLAKMINGPQILPHLKKAQAILPNAAGVDFGLGAYYLLAPAIGGGDVDKAREYLERAIEKDPLLADAYVRLAQVYKVKGDQEQFSHYLNKALEIDPRNILANDVKSQTCHFICFDE